MSYGAYPRTTATTQAQSSSTSQYGNNNQYMAPKVNARSKVRLRVSYTLQNSGVQHRRHCFGINSLAFNEDDGHLYSAGRDSTVRCWDVNKVPVPEHLLSFEHHTDWVNDIFLCNNNKTLVSCSSDASIKIWDAKTAQCSRTLNRHGDYVKALSYAPQAEMFASAGLDTNIFVWDLQQCTAPVVALSVTSSPSLSCSSGFRNNVAPVVRTGVEKGSLYSLAMNANASIVLSGSTEKLVRAWDPRSGQKIFKLKGHTDNIKALQVNSEGTLCVSGSSDFTLRLWDLRQQQCIHVFEVHDDSIWSVAVDPSFTNIYSGGRDGSVFVTDLVSSTSTLVCMEQNPVVKLLYSKHGGEDSLWVTTTDSCIKNWPLEPNANVQQKRVYSPPPTLSSSPTTSSFQGSKSAPIVSAPRATILGRPGMVKHHILNNRRHVLTKDSSGTVELWDITQGKQLESFGTASFESKVEALTEIISVPNWFSVDTKTGSLTVRLDSPQCFSAEVYAGDVFEDLPEEDEELQMNLGESVLRALFSYWEEGRRALDANKNQSRHLQPPSSHSQLPNSHSFEHDKKSSNAKVSNPNESNNHTDNNSNPTDKLTNSANISAPTSRPTTPNSLVNSTSNKLANSNALSHSTSLNSSTTLGNSSVLVNSSSKGGPNGTTSMEDHRERKIPMLNLPGDVSVIISEEGTGATMHRATRSQYVGDEPPEIIPPWVSDCLLHNDIPQNTMRALAVKLGFFLVSADEKELPALPQGNGRLSALRLLRIRKVAKYVVTKLEIELPLVSELKGDTHTPTPTPTSTSTPSNTSTTPGTTPTNEDHSQETGGSSESEGDDKAEERVLPEQYIDIICNNKVMHPSYSLATVKAFFWKSGDENIVLQYRINPAFESDTSSTDAHPHTDKKGRHSKAKAQAKKLLSKDKDKDKDKDKEREKEKEKDKEKDKESGLKRNLFHRKT